MAEVLLFHHAQGLTPGVLEFAGQLRAAGHTVHTPDLYDGRVFAELEVGVAHAEQLGFSEIIARGAAVARDLPGSLVYAGFSLGALPAQALAQTRAGAAGALLFHGGVASRHFGPGWPAGVPLQLHVTEADPWSELDECQALVAEVDSAELYRYPGSGHLFADSGSPDFDPGCARLLTERTLAFLRQVP